MTPTPKPLPTAPDLNLQAQLLFHPERNPTRYKPFENASEFPFRARADGWSRVNAWWLADAAWLAYQHNAPEVASVLHDQAALQSEMISHAGTDCFVARCEAFTIVAFRGTQPDEWPDIFDDVK